MTEITGENEAGGSGAEDDAGRARSGQEHLARVKWFDAVRGFGFVVVRGLEGDVLLHANVLRAAGIGAIVEGACVRVRIVETPRGRQVSELVEVLPPEEGEAQGAPQALEAGPLRPARVKWFDRERGFGFVNLFGEADDVFLHQEVLRRTGMADVESGSAVAVRVVHGPRGRLAVELCPWDAALEEGQGDDDGGAERSRTG